MTGKEDLATHLTLCEQAFAELHRQENSGANPKRRIVVLVMDGARTHTGRGQWAYAYDPYNMNMNVSSALKPVTLASVLGRSVIDGPPKLTIDQARAEAFRAESVRKYLMPAERIALLHGGCTFWLPNAHPQLNAVCEKLWRAIKMEYASLAVVDHKASKLLEIINKWLAPGMQSEMFKLPSDARKCAAGNRT